MPPDLVGEMYTLVPHIARAIITSINGNGFNVSQNNGRSANQIIPTCTCPYNSSIST